MNTEEKKVTGTRPDDLEKARRTTTEDMRPPKTPTLPKEKEREKGKKTED
jgi:hypothetical protein